MNEKLVSGAFLPILVGLIIYWILFIGFIWNIRQVIEWLFY